ncbi:hypothetical protein GOP47_0025296 [Adiantum capillus-veneris]|uniref:Cytochrome P450 n=1 Tax=Adiantum capillus-veneris TaxID=13818 RepID=A0A9D4U0S4_ADICA|nr:hypothetical protein GOP47_0025296 [Adiantum capillus-veneris]
MGAVPHRTMHRLALRYGPIFLLRLGCRPMVVISSPALVKEFLHLHDHLFAHRPPSHFAFHGSQGSAFMSQGPRRRSLRQQILSPKSVAASKQIRHQEMAALLHRLRRLTPGTPLEIRSCVFDWMLNVMARVLFSEKPQADDDHVDHNSQLLQEFPAAFRDLSELFGRPLLADFLPWLHGSLDPRRLEREVVREAARMDRILNGVVRKRLALLASAGTAPVEDVLTTVLKFEGHIYSSRFQQQIFQAGGGLQGV